MNTFRNFWTVLSVIVDDFSIRRMRVAALANKELDRPLCVSHRKRAWLLTQLRYLDYNRLYAIVRRLVSNDGEWEELRTHENILDALQTLPRRDQDKLMEEYLLSLDNSNPNCAIEMLYEMHGNHLPVVHVAALYHDATNCVMTDDICKIIWLQSDKFARERITHTIALGGWLDAVKILFDPMKPRAGIDMSALLNEHVNLCLSRYTQDGTHVLTTIQGSEDIALEAATMVQNWAFVESLLTYLHDHLNDPSYNKGTYEDIIKKTILVLYNAGRLQLNNKVEVSTPADLTSK